MIGTFSLLFSSRWLELRPLLKVSSILGLVIGGIGSWKTLSLVGPGIINVFSSPFGLYALFFFIGFLLLGGPAALVSSLCLVFLSLTDEQKHTLGFLSLMGSATTLFVLPYYFYFVMS